MDIVAHGLWSNLAYARARHLAVGGVLFGLAPDLVTFGPQVILALTGFAEGFHPHGNIPGYMYTLYNWTHSLVVAATFALIAGLLWRRIPWVMSGWFLHVILDIGTHSRDFFPTPFLYPVADFYVDGVPWTTPWVMIVNYGLLILFYGLWFIKRKRRLKPALPEATRLGARVKGSS